MVDHTNYLQESGITKFLFSQTRAESYWLCTVRTKFLLAVHQIIHNILYNKYMHTFTKRKLSI